MRLLRGFSRGLLAVVIALFVALPVSAPEAHKYYGILSDLKYNARTGSLEIIHRFFAHDMEAALSSLTGADVHFGDDALPEDDIQRYLADHFALQINATDVSLRWVGAELEGETLWVYQEVPLAGPPRRLSVTNSMLTDLFSAEINTVTASIGDAVRSATFRAGEDRADMEFED